jgi:hypothetical protein
MAVFEPAVLDLNWLEPEQLYFALGDQCEIDRPLFQGDVFAGVPLPILPKQVPSGACEIEFVDSVVMVVPHPCQCYHGDKLRPFITVAPVSQVLNYDNFGADLTGKKDSFALPDLLGEDGVSYVANFGKVTSLPYSYLPTNKRIACLSHMGIGLLSKRFIQFQARVPSRLGEVMAFSQDQWNEAFLMQAWVQKHGKLKGFAHWLRNEVVIESINSAAPLVPQNYVTSSLAELIEELKRA